MTNNDILKRLRYTFDFGDDKVIELYSHVEFQVTREMVCNWLKTESDEDYKNLTDTMLAAFLNGLIVENRGKREGPPPVPEKELTNNLVLKKLKIALNLKTEDISAICALVGTRLGATEVGSFLRNPRQPQYRNMNNQYLRKFLMGLQLKHRPESKASLSH